MPSYHKTDTPGRVLSLAAEVWTLLVSPVVLQVLLLLLFFILVLGSIWPERLAAASAIEAAYAQVSAIAVDQGGIIGSLERLLLGALGLVCLVRFLNLWLPAWSLPPRHGVARRALMCSGEPNTLVSNTAGSAAARGLVVTGQSWTGNTVGRLLVMRHGERFAALAYLGVLLLVCATLVQWRFGWVSEARELVLGQVGELDRGSGLEAALVEIEMVNGKAGEAELRSASLALKDATGAEKRVALAPGKPASMGHYTIYLVGDGPAVRVEATRVGAGEERLLLQPVVGDVVPKECLRLSLSDREQEQLVLIPEAGLIVRLVRYAVPPSGQAATPGLHVQVLRAATDEVLAEGFVTDAKVFSVDQVRLSLAVERFVTIRAAKYPGFPLAAIGTLLLVPGLVVDIFRPPRPLWLLVEAAGEVTRVEIITYRRHEGDRWVEAICEALVGSEAA